MLTWEGGHWAHKYDVYLGTNESKLDSYRRQTWSQALSDRQVRRTIWFPVSKTG